MSDYEYSNSADSPYKDVVGHHVRSRYLTEDVSGLNVPAFQLAEEAAVETPIIELTIRLSSWLHGVDYVFTGTTLEKLGIADKEPAEIVALTSQGLIGFKLGWKKMLNPFFIPSIPIRHYSIIPCGLTREWPQKASGFQQIIEISIH